jgi:hypothetical protein
MDDCSHRIQHRTWQRCCAYAAHPSIFGRRLLGSGWSNRYALGCDNQSPIAALNRVRLYQR